MRHTNIMRIHSIQSKGDIRHNHTWGISPNKSMIVLDTIGSWDYQWIEPGGCEMQLYFTNTHKKEQGRYKRQ